MTVVLTEEPQVETKGNERPCIVLDTSVLVSDPDCLDGFEEADVVIPLTTIEELDTHKRRQDDVGHAARVVLRRLEEIRAASGAEIRDALPLPHRSTVRIEPNGLQLDVLEKFGLDPSSLDNRILAAALVQMEHNPNTTVLSADTAMRVKAAALGLHARALGADEPLDDNDTGWETIEVNGGLIDDLYVHKAIDANEVADCWNPHVGNLPPNRGAVLRASGTSQSALVRRNGDQIVTVDHNTRAWGLQPRSAEQRFALDLLMDRDVQIVGLDGPSGCGKTILAVAAGLEQVVEQRHYERLMILRPVVPVGRYELGFLPGSLEEKLGPWMAAIQDSLTALTENGSQRDAVKVTEDLVNRGQIVFDTVTHLRGRSLANSYVIVDEAQNLERATTKTILTRVAEGSKIVFTGDLDQIDHVFNSRTRNALASLLSAFGGTDVFGHVRLTHCERSRVADMAAKML